MGKAASCAGRSETTPAVLISRAVQEPELDAVTKAAASEHSCAGD